MQQPNLTRVLDRIYGDAASPRNYDLPAQVLATLDALELTPLETVRDVSTTTPAAGRTATITVPAGQIWRVWFITSYNANNAVVQTHSAKLQDGFLQLPLSEATTPAANAYKVTRLDEPVPVGPGGTVAVTFGAGVLNDTTVVDIYVQRFYF